MEAKTVIAEYEKEEKAIFQKTTIRGKLFCRNCTSIGKFNSNGGAGNMDPYGIRRVQLKCTSCSTSRRFDLVFQDSVEKNTIDNDEYIDFADQHKIAVQNLTDIRAEKATTGKPGAQPVVIVETTTMRQSSLEKYAYSSKAKPTQRQTKRRAVELDDADTSYTEMTTAAGNGNENEILMGKEQHMGPVEDTMDTSVTKGIPTMPANREYQEIGSKINNIKSDTPEIMAILQLLTQIFALLQKERAENTELKDEIRQIRRDMANNVIPVHTPNTQYQHRQYQRMDQGAGENMQPTTNRTNENPNKRVTFADEVKQNGNGQGRQNVARTYADMVMEKAKNPKKTTRPVRTIEVNGAPQPAAYTKLLPSRIAPRKDYEIITVDIKKPKKSNNPYADTRAWIRQNYNVQRGIADISFIGNGLTQLLLHPFDASDVKERLRTRIIDYSIYDTSNPENDHLGYDKTQLMQIMRRRMAYWLAQQRCEEAERPIIAQLSEEDKEIVKEAAKRLRNKQPMGLPRPERPQQERITTETPQLSMTERISILEHTTHNDAMEIVPVSNNNHATNNSLASDNTSQE